MTFLSLDDRDGTGEGHDDIEELLNKAGDCVESAASIDETGQRLDIGEKALNGGDSAVNLGSEGSCGTREVTSAEGGHDVESTLHLGLNIGKSGIDISFSAIKDALDDGVRIANSAGDGGENWGEDSQETISGAGDGCEEATNV